MSRTCEARSVIRRDGSLTVVHSHGDEDPTSVVVPAWAVRVIFRLAGRDPDQEARKIDAALARLRSER